MRPEQAMISAAWNGYHTALYQVNILLGSAASMEASTRKDEILGVAHFFQGIYLLQPGYALGRRTRVGKEYDR